MSLKNEVLASARNTLTIEADAVIALRDRIDDSFYRAVEMISGCSGRLVITATSGC